MDSFSELLHKLREVHERELDTWQQRVQELSNKKGCDIKRMEDLFNRNQQMKEQQRILTDNIKTLENRLRAGLCDRCTVTQEVAKRRQQEYESFQIQSLHQFSIMVGEMNNLKKENKRLREELISLRKAMESQSEHFSNSMTPDVKPTTSPDLSPPAAPVVLTTTTAHNTSKQTEGGDVAVKTEADHKSEGANPIDKLLDQIEGTLLHSVDSPDQRSLTSISNPTHVMLLKNVPASLSSSCLSSTSTGRELTPGRHMLHAPVPCRPHPIKSAPRPFPWSLSELSDWASVSGSTGRGPSAQLNSKSNPFLFPSISPTVLHAGHPGQGVPARRPGEGSAWPKQCPPQTQAKEPTPLFRVRSLSELGDSQAIAQERKEMASIHWRSTGAASQPQRVFGEGHVEGSDGPLDLSERGRSRSSEAGNGARSLESWTYPSEGAHFSSSSPPVVPMGTSSTSSSQPDEQMSRDHYQESNVEEECQREEKRKLGDPSNKQKVPALTISLQPVVLLGTLNSALHKYGMTSSNSKFLKQGDPGSSSEEPGKEGSSESGAETSPASKRTRTSTDRNSSRDSDTDDSQPQKKVIRVVSQDLSTR